MFCVVSSYDDLVFVVYCMFVFYGWLFECSVCLLGAKGALGIMVLVLPLEVGLVRIVVHYMLKVPCGDLVAFVSCCLHECGALYLM